MLIPTLSTRVAVTVTATAAAALVGVLPAFNGAATPATAPAAAPTAAPAVPVSAPATVELPVTPVAPSMPSPAGSSAVSHAMSKVADALAAAADGANVLHLGVNELLGTGPEVQSAALSAPLVADPLVAVAPVAPVAPEPVVGAAASLVKAADLQTAADAAEQAKAAEAARAAEATKKARPAASVRGAVQMVIGRVTSGFGARWGSLHQGLDIAAPIGTPIRVPVAGTVINSGPASGFGLWVRVKHADGTITVYGHINRSLVRVGQRVSAGQEIAEVGNRGQATGPHLHIEVITPGGTKINPRPWLDQHGIGY